MADQFYSIRDLYLFKEFTRATWTAAHDSQPKPFIVKDRIKRWSDPTAPALTDPQSARTYLVWDASAQRQREITMTAQEAVEVNLPGNYIWPKYAASVSVATVLGPDGTKYPFNHRYLLSKEQVAVLIDKINGDLSQPGLYTAVQVNDDERFPWRVLWGDEARRQWKLIRSNDLNAVKEAALVYEMLVSKGIGAPGKFSEVYNTGGHWELAWTSEVPNDEPHNTLPEVPVPMRCLRDNERVQPSPFGDMVYSVSDVALPASTKDLAELRTLLVQILDAIKAQARPPFVGGQ